MKRFARRVNPMLPSVDYNDAQHGYFIHNGCIHSIENVASAIFRDAVLSKKPNWDARPEYACLLGQDIDMLTRWYLLCRLAEENVPITLYQSREAAEQALQDVAAAE